jgi:hypothetical protein
MFSARWIWQSNENRQALWLANGESEAAEGEGELKGKGKFTPPLSLPFSSSSARLWLGKPLGTDATPGESFEEYRLPGDDTGHDRDQNDDAKESNIVSTLDISSSSDSEDSDSSVRSGPRRPTKALATLSARPSTLTSIATNARTEWPEGDVTYHCHQCHRPTDRVYMKCKNEGIKCKIKYCIRCASQR